MEILARHAQKSGARLQEQTAVTGPVVEQLRELRQRRGTVEEHQQPDAGDGIEVARELESAQVRGFSAQLQAFMRRDLAQVPDGGLAGVEGEHVAAAPGGLHGQVAETAAVVQHRALEMGEGSRFERIQRVVTGGHLPPELCVEERDAAVAVHGTAV